MKMTNQTNPQGEAGASRTWSNQQIFDTVLTGLRLQGEPSQGRFHGNSMPLCAYRAQSEYDPSKTLKCAAGLLIDDEMYRPDWEGKDAGLIRSVGGFGDKIEYFQEPFVLRLQRAHDEQLTKGFPEWEKAMQDIAEFYSLTYSKPATAAT